MTYCIVPGCRRPFNPDNHRICHACGADLLLNERYRPLQAIGQGGFGKTFMAIDEHLPSKPQCVIKQLWLRNSTPQEYAKAVQLFRQEAVHLDNLGQYSHIPSLLAHFEQNRLLYLVQELVAGQTLEQEAMQRGAYTETEIVEVLQNLLPTLGFIHQHNVIHRDIKPSNIIRRKQDNALVLIDFGVSKVVSEATVLRTGTIIGTAEYMAPEQNRGKVFPASDIYSLGVVCINLLTQESPFDLFDIEHDCWVWRDRVPKGQRVSHHLTHILDKMLRNAVSQRYQSAEAVLQDLNNPTPLQASNHVSGKSTSLSSSANFRQSRADVSSKANIDYQSLRKLLANGKWQQADVETWDIIRILLAKPIGGFIFSGDLHRIPCGDLQTLDRLWLKYSRGRFGFSVQVRIYQAAGKDYAKFCDYVGWQRDNQRDQPNQWHFNYLAPPGHLPSRLGMGGQQWWRHVQMVSDRLTECSR
jgi:serine/threonine protein kinase